MLAEWRQAQREVWELDAEAQHLRASSRSSLDRLLRQRRHYAEVGLAARRFRRGASASVAASAPAAAAACGGAAAGPEAGEVVELEALMGRDAAQVWAGFLQSIARHPGALPVLAREVGYAGHELLARLASALVGDPVRSALGGGCPAARVLDEILGAEFERLPPSPGCEAAQASTLLSDGAFLTALAQELTAHEPACMVWARSVLSPDVLEAVSRLLRAAPPRQRAGAGAPTTPPARVRTQSLDAFLGEAAGPDESSALCGAAAAVVSSLCARASAAPLGLCRLAAALCRQLDRRPPTDGVRQEDAARRARHALLGSLLLGRWLVPAMLAPGAGFVLHADSNSRSALTTLAKLLKAIASDAQPASSSSGARGWGPEDGAVFGGASPAFVGREAQRLSAGLFEILVARGACECDRAEDGDDVTWPQCIACTTADLAMLSQAFASESVASTAAQSLNMPANAVRTLSRLRPDAAGALEVLCWLQRQIDPPPDFALEQSRAQGLEEAHRLLQQGRAAADRPARGRGSPKVVVPASPLPAARVDLDAGDSMLMLGLPESPVGPELEGSPLSGGGRAGGTDVSGEGLTARIQTSCPRRGSQSLLLAWARVAIAGNRARTSTTGSSELGSLLDEGVEELVILPMADPVDVEGDDAEGPSAAGGERSPLLPHRPDGYGEAPDDDVRLGLLLLWQVLADPRPLDGSADAPLVQALAAGHSHEAGGALPRQLRLEMLAEVLRRPGAGDAGGAEAELLRGLRSCLAAQRAAAAVARGALAHLQVAERLVGQQCAQARQALKHHVRLVAELRCNACLQALWAAPASADSGHGACPPYDAGRSSGAPPPLELCVVGPPADVLSSKRRAEALAGRKASGANVCVKVYERSRCPCHTVVAVTATMGFDSRLEDGFKHWSVRSLGQVVKALQKLPLESAVRGCDPYGIAAALHNVLDLTVRHVIANFRLAPVVTAAEACAVFGMGPGEPGADPASGPFEEWTPPSSLTCIDSNHLRECVARFLFTHLHMRLFPQEPTDADFRVAERARQLRWLQPKHLDVPATIVEAPQVERAARTLQRLHRLRSPVQMLAELAHAFRSVTEAACIRAQVRAAASSGGDGDAFGADSSLPLFILVVLRANPPMFSSVLAYAECFIAPAQKLTEQGYALTQAHAAVTFTESARPEDLNGLEPGEWERHMGAGGASSRT